MGEGNVEDEAEDREQRLAIQMDSQPRLKVFRFKYQKSSMDEENEK